MKEKFKAIETDFNESMFITKINNIFIKLFTNIMLDNLKEVDHFISDEVYNYAQDIINKAKDIHGIQMFDELNIKNSMITDYDVTDDNLIIKVLLVAKYLDYIIDIDSKEKIRGDDYQRKEQTYELTFIKKRKTKNQEISRKCPGCGAPISVNTSGLCAYCGSIYNQEDYDWILKNIKEI